MVSVWNRIYRIGEHSERYRLEDLLKLVQSSRMMLHCHCPFNPNEGLARLSQSRPTARMKEHCEGIERIELDDDQIFWIISEQKFIF
jgi:hypothetical protein